MAEAEMRTKQPKTWLLHGPGRETGMLPGWSAPAKPVPGEDRQLNVLEHPEIVALFREIKEALEPYPEALAAVLRKLEEARLALSGTK
jgi:hypothetical protein